MKRRAAVLLAILAASSACSPSETTFDGFGDGKQKLRVVNRQASKLDDRNGVRLSGAPGNGVAWIEGSDFQTGTIEVDVRGQESLGQLYVGIAFHRKSDDSYEAVYLRPFNFRAADPVRKQHALQYILLPDYDWPRLREDYAEQFENPVDASLEPTGWVRLRVAMDAHKLQIFAGPVTQPTLEVRKLGELSGGQVGLWVGNDSGGDFANLVMTPTKR